MTTSRKAPVVVVGAGYVGLVTAVGIAKKRAVRLVDRQAGLIAGLEAGRVPIAEPGLEQRYEKHRDQISLHTSLSEALGDRRPQLVFVAVGTPSRAGNTSVTNGEDGDAANLDAVHSLVDELLPYEGLSMVMKSTVPPGTGREITRRATACGSSLSYLSCPEFLQEGAAFETFDEPNRIVVGRDAASWASQALRELHRELHPELEPERYLEMDLTAAEMVKHAANLQLATRISYANEIGNLCEEIGADVTEVMRGVGADDRIGPRFLRAGIGFGGSCFEKDIRALRSLARKTGRMDLSLVDTVLEVNVRQAVRVVDKLERRLGALDGKRVAVLGLAFKPNTDDLRGSPAFTIADLLRCRSAQVRAWDPEQGALERAERNYATGDGPEGMAPAELAGSALDAIDGADAVVLATEWPAFTEIEWNLAAAAMRGSLVLDGRNHLDPGLVRAAGLEYEGTGRDSPGLSRPLPEGATES